MTALLVGVVWARRRRRDRERRARLDEGWIVASPDAGESA